jgi:hypothetical protein
MSNVYVVQHIYIWYITYGNSYLFTNSKGATHGWTRETGVCYYKQY